MHIPDTPKELSETPVHTPPKLWFRAKRFGWGWYPCTIEGWAILLLYVVSLVSSAVFADTHAGSVSDFLTQFVPNTAVLTAFLVIICYLSGEKPRWRWGRRSHDSET